MRQTSSGSEHRPDSSHSATNRQAAQRLGVTVYIAPKISKAKPYGLISWLVANILDLGHGNEHAIVDAGPALQWRMSSTADSILRSGKAKNLDSK